MEQQRFKMMLISTFLAFLVTMVISVGSVDLTREPETSGCEVVLACVDTILQSDIFPSDKEIVRRIAYVESKDGKDRNTYRDGYHGGIWQVDKIGFDDTQNVGAHPSLSRKFEEIRDSILNIDWLSVVWSDLRKPLYSAIAARLFLSNIPEALPNSADIDGQARYWKHYYNSDDGEGSDENFINDVHALHNSEECKCYVKGVEIAFVMDGSGSIGSSNFQTAKQFVLEVAKGFTIGLDATRVAVIQYESSPMVEFDFDDYSTIATLETAINGIGYRNGGTETGLAITRMVGNLFVDSGGARPSDMNFPRIGIVVTDGKSEDDVMAPADNARAAGITMFAIGVGGYNIDELQEIANDPDSKHVFQVDNFDVIENINSLLTSATCRVPIEVPPDTPIADIIPPGATRYLSYEIPPSHTMTVKINTTTGEVVAYLSTVISNPSAAFHEWKMETTSSVRYVQLFIDFNTTDVISNRRRRRQSIDSYQTTLFCTIENKATGNGTDQMPADINTISEEGNTLIPTTAKMTTEMTQVMTTEVLTTTTFMETKQPPNYGGPYPSPEYPDVPENAEKTIRVEIKVLAVPIECDIQNNESSKACQEFQEHFITEVELSYKAIAGFRRVEIVQLLANVQIDGIAGEIIVEHEVIYSWNDMDSADRGLTADEVYAITVADDIESGLIGNNLTVGLCPECSSPQDTTQLICTVTTKITCGNSSNTWKYLDPYCIDGIPICMSPCLNTNLWYCDLKHGICTHEHSHQAPECSCERTSNMLYYGTRCRQSLNKTWLYIGVPLAVFLVMLIIATIFVCLVISKNNKGKGTD